MNKLSQSLLILIIGISTILISPWPSALGNSLSTISPQLLALSSQPSTFSDISPNSQLKTITTELSQKGILEGYQDGTFRPDQTINRAETLKIIFTTLGLKNSENCKIEKLKNCVPPFSDTPTNSWFFPHVQTALNKKIIQGYPDGTFKPTQDVNRAEFIKMAVSSLPFLNNVNYSTRSIHQHYQDLEPEAWYLPHISIGHTLGVLPTTPQLHPTENMTRGDAAEIIFNILAYGKKYPSALDPEHSASFIPPQSIISISELKEQQSYFPNNDPSQFSIIPKHLNVSKQITTTQGYRIDYGDPSPIIDATFQYGTLSIQLINDCNVDIMEIKGYSNPEEYFQSELNKGPDDYPSAKSSSLSQLNEANTQEGHYEVEIIWANPDAPHSFEHFVWTSDKNVYRIHSNGTNKSEQDCDATELNTMKSFSKPLY